MAFLWTARGLQFVEAPDIKDHDLETTRQRP